MASGTRACLNLYARVRTMELNAAPPSNPHIVQDADKWQIHVHRYQTQTEGLKKLREFAALVAALSDGADQRV